MVRSSLLLAAFAAIASVHAATKCNLDSHCPESQPCCSRKYYYYSPEYLDHN
jgi:hypothetical protein